MLEDLLHVVRNCIRRDRFIATVDRRKLAGKSDTMLGAVKDLID